MPKNPRHLKLTDLELINAIMASCEQVYVPGSIAEHIAVDVARNLSKPKREVDITGVLPTEDNPWGFVPADDGTEEDVASDLVALKCRYCGK